MGRPSAVKSEKDDERGTLAIPPFNHWPEGRHGRLRSPGVWVALAPLSLKRIDEAVAQRRAK